MWYINNIQFVGTNTKILLKINPIRRCTLRGVLEV